MLVLLIAPSTEGERRGDGRSEDAGGEVEVTLPRNKDSSRERNVSKRLNTVQRPFARAVSLSLPQSAAEEHPPYSKQQRTHVKKVS
jgi:hypothetical protein